MTLAHEGLELGKRQDLRYQKVSRLVKGKPLIGCNRSATGGVFPQRSVPAGRHRDKRRLDSSYIPTDGRSGSVLAGALPYLGERLVPSDAPGVRQVP